ncbi:hypothetical protein Droror1_Dr00006015 [Drosera rotundifolia]
MVIKSSAWALVPGPIRSTSLPRMVLVLGMQSLAGKRSLGSSSAKRGVFPGKLRQAKALDVCPTAPDDRLFVSDDCGQNTEQPV